MAEDKKSEQPIIVKKIVKGGGHHGGAWKVAYADFVTAMMAFFLLLWLLNVSTDEQIRGISDYFDPTATKVSDNDSGAGGVLGGLSMSPEGAMATNIQNLSMPNTQMPRSATQAHKYGDKTKEPSTEEAKEKLRKEEEKKFKETEEALKKAIEQDPELAALSKNLKIDMTPEGLRIQILDQDKEPMFASGSAQMFDKTKKLLGKVSELISAVPNEVSIRGHTDNKPYGDSADYTNWELSSDRANATRRVLKDSGIAEQRLNNVMGKADTEPLLPDDPSNAQNRRISIILLKEELTNPEGFSQKAQEQAVEDAMDAEEEAEGGTTNGGAQVPIGTYRKTPGEVQFP